MLVVTNTVHIQTLMPVRSVLFQALRHARLDPGRWFGRQTLKFGIVGGLALSLLIQPRSRAADQDGLDSSLNEHVIYVDSDPAHWALLQVTTFYPDGEGPFPVAIINHSKAPG